MRIGIVTFYDGRTNYGQALQCYALISYLKTLGHDAFYIRYDNSVPFKRGKLKELISTLYHWLTNPRKEIDRKKRKSARDIMISKDREHPRGFDVFMKEHIPSTDKVYTKNTTYGDFPYADAYICGSDQIWGGVDPIFYLQFAPKGSRKIAYAPSFGGFIPDREKRGMVKKYIRDFDLISCREKSGIKLCNELGRKDALLFPDPTLLLSSRDYRFLCTKSDVNIEDYIFLYLLGNEINIEVESFFKYAESVNKKIIYVASQGRFDKFPKTYPTIGEWLYLIDHAACVITNSFHGTVFCLHFKKRFLTIPLVGKFAKQNDRIYDLLEKYHLLNRIYNGDLNLVMTDLNFDSFDSIHQEEIQFVNNLLTKQLS